MIPAAALRWFPGGRRCRGLRAFAVVYALVLVFLGFGSGRAQSILEIVSAVPAAANTQFPDEDGDFPGYVVIRSLSTVVLSGHHLTDQQSVPGKWQFPPGYTLANGQTIRVFASGKNRRPTGPNGVLHTSFAFDCSVPYVALTTAQLSLRDAASDPVNRCVCRGLDLLERATSVRSFVPKQDLGDDWIKPDFIDKDWTRGLLGVGYDRNGSPYADGLVLHHSMDKADVAGDVVKDVSGPILHLGALTGSSSMTGGRVNEAFNYKAEPASFVRVAHHAELDPGTGNFAAAIWFFPARAGSQLANIPFEEVLISKSANNAALTGWSITRNQSGTFVNVGSSAGVKTVSLGSTLIPQWYHVVLVVNRATGQLIGYLNGKRMGVATIGANENFGSTGHLFESRDGAGVARYLGLLDEFSIWSRALSDAQVGELYSLGSGGKSFLDPSQFPASSSLYGGLIGTDLINRMPGVNASAYVRIPFTIPNLPSQASALSLRINYDDGFVAYLNGVECARRNAPDSVAWNSKSVVNRPDTAALMSEVIDLTDFMGVLRPGGNVLAFQMLNSDINAERVLLYPRQLCLEVGSTAPTDPCVKETNGRNFWIAFPENYVQEGDTPLQLSLCIAGAPNVKGIVEIPGINVPGFPKNFTIPASGTLTIAIPSAVELSGAERVEDKAVHITANADVAVYGTTRMDFSTDSFLAIPVRCLGTEYLVATYRNVFDTVPILNGTQLAVVAVANSTDVTITPRTSVGGHPAGVPFTVKLQRGQTYQLRNESSKPADLTGTRISSNKPISVFGAHRCANIESVNRFFCDVLVEQLLPVSLWGSDYIAIPFTTRSNYTMRVISAGDDNLVTVTSMAGAQGFVLQSGETREVLLDRQVRVTSRKPVLVLQYSNSSDTDGVIDADPFMTMIQPAETWLSRYRICTPKTNDFGANFINIVAPGTVDLESVTVNGLLLSAFPPGSVVKGPVPGGLAYAQVRLQPGTSYLIEGKNGLGLTAYGYSEFDSYGYPGGMRFDDGFAPIIQCPPAITLSCEGSEPNCVVRAPDLLALAEVFDDCTPEKNLVLTQSPKAGDPLVPGTYQFVLRATDSHGNVSQCTVTVTVQSSWKDRKFGANITANAALESTVWGAAADPDKDGIPNSIEEALGGDPNKADQILNILQLSIASEKGVQYLKVGYPRPVVGNGPAVVLEGRRVAEGAEWASGPDIFEELTSQRVLLPGGESEMVYFKALETVGKLSEQLYFVRLRVR